MLCHILSIGRLYNIALAADPARRIGAAEFAERLGRYVRREQDWEILRFGDGGRPLVAGEWSTLRGEWDLSSYGGGMDRLGKKCRCGGICAKMHFHDDLDWLLPVGSA